MAKQQKDTFYDSPVLENKLLSPHKSFARHFSSDDTFRKSSIITLQKITELFFDSSNMQMPLPGPVNHIIFDRTNHYFSKFESEINVLEGDVNRYVLAFTYTTQISPIFKGKPVKPKVVHDLNDKIMKFHSNRIRANTLMKKGTEDVCTLEEKFAILGKDSLMIADKLTDDEKLTLSRQTARYVFEFSNEKYSRVAHLLANGYMSACVAVGLKNMEKTFNLYMNAHNAHKRKYDGVLFLAV